MDSNYECFDLIFLKISSLHLLLIIFIIGIYLSLLKIILHLCDMFNSFIYQFHFAIIKFFHF